VSVCVCEHCLYTLFLDRQNITDNIEVETSTHLTAVPSYILTFTLKNRAGNSSDSTLQLYYLAISR